MSSSICSTQAHTHVHVMDCPKTWCGLTLTVNLELSFRKLSTPQCHPQPLPDRPKHKLGSKGVILTNCTKCSNGHKKWLRTKHWNHGCQPSPHIPPSLLNPQDTAELHHHCAPCQGRCCWKAEKNRILQDTSMTYQSIVEFICSNHVHFKETLVKSKKYNLTLPADRRSEHWFDIESSDLKSTYDGAWDGSKGLNIILGTLALLWKIKWIHSLVERLQSIALHHQKTAKWSSLWWGQGVVIQMLATAFFGKLVFHGSKEMLHGCVCFHL